METNYCISDRFFLKTIVTPPLITNRNTFFFLLSILKCSFIAYLHENKIKLKRFYSRKTT